MAFAGWISSRKHGVKQDCFFGSLALPAVRRLTERNAPISPRKVMKRHGRLCPLANWIEGDAGYLQADVYYDFIRHEQVLSCLKLTPTSD